MLRNRNLLDARRKKNDEFYTQYVDIENELCHYQHQFKNKVVYCNCDDPSRSNFYRFFKANFESYGLKKLIATCYIDQQLNLFSSELPEKPLCGIYDGHSEQVSSLHGDGDFRSAESIELLKQSHIVVTNPPFSLFRQYVTQLVKYEKQFLILGNMNAITCKNIFPLIKGNKVWLGISPGVMDFMQPNGETNNVYAVWFTNLQHDKHNKELILSKQYSPEEYPHYDNYDAIDVSKTKDIPKDWAGYMGVPITFLDNYNPDQFEILGASEQCGRGFSNGLWDSRSKITKPLVKGEKKYSRLFIRNKQIAR